MKSKWSTVILVVIFLTGISLLLYPSVSDYWNSFHQTRAIAGYVEAVTDMDSEEYERILADARAYNEQLLLNDDRYHLTDEEKEAYNNTLRVTDDGMMGYIEINKLRTRLPIYHGLEDTVLQVAIGHISGTSLPVGGPGTHTVISGHRGLPSAKLFTDIDELVEGDTFVINVLDETLTYEVDRISTVLPYEIDNLEIEEGKDYCTLVTCTPYGVNSHRLLVRGHRVANAPEDVRVSADAILIDPMLSAPLAAVPILVLLLIGLQVVYRRRYRRHDRTNRN